MGPNSWSLEYPIREFGKALSVMQREKRPGAPRPFLPTEHWLHMDVSHYSPVYHQSGHFGAGREGEEGVSPGAQMLCKG